ncbi:MAG TPA: mercuric reductase [Gemmatimonadales bacterium]|nr:mercuric reductase [Gemmatimonadales bacterium]
MAEAEKVENLVLGGGEAGKYVAWELAKAGRPVTVVERALVGGSCPNVACLPSKNIIASARVAALARRLESYGARAGAVEVDMAGVRARKRAMVSGMIRIHEQRFAAPGIEFVLGEGVFTGPRSLQVKLAGGGTRRITAERVFLNLGTHAAIPPVPGLAAAAPLTHVEALELGRLPEHLVVLGGGPVGCELAQAFRRFGALVTILQRGPQLLPREDPDLAEEVRAVFLDEGIEVVLGAETLAVEGRSGEHLALRVATPAGERRIEASDLLVAAGRSPSTGGIDLDAAGVEVDARGYVKVDEQLRTSVPKVWAMGDCAGSPQFTHVAFDDFRIVRAQLDSAGWPARSTRDRLVPHCTFLDPELGRVGLSETEARHQRREVRVVTLPLSAVLRARAIGETRGLMKVLLDTTSDRILGFTMLGVGAGEVIAVVQTAMLAGLPYPALRDALFTHPTMAEGLNVLFAGVPARAGTGA